jgi:RimJ/RimL family protein N-acetyltransferase
MVTFEEVTEETLYIADEIVNSNPIYNELENGADKRSQEELRRNLLNPKTISVFIKLEDTYIGILGYLRENPTDHCPWLGILMIHRDYQGYGFGTQAYFLFESIMVEKGVPILRLGVLKGNEAARKFWEGLGFVYYETKKERSSGNIVDCFEKHL